MATGALVKMRRSRALPAKAELTQAQVDLLQVRDEDRAGIVTPCQQAAIAIELRAERLTGGVDSQGNQLILFALNNEGDASCVSEAVSVNHPPSGSWPQSIGRIGEGSPQTSGPNLDHHSR